MNVDLCSVKKRERNLYLYVQKKKKNLLLHYERMT